MSIISSYIMPHSQILIPEIAQGKEEKANATIKAMKDVASRIAKDAPDTIILISAHSEAYTDYFHVSPDETAEGNFGDYGFPEISFKANLDKELAEEIANICSEEGVSGGTDGDPDTALDHGALVPMYYLNKKTVKSCKFLRVSISAQSLLNHYVFGKCIQKAADKLDRKVTVLVSGDMSHRVKEDGPYGYSKEAANFDSTLSTAFSRGNFLGFFAFDDELVENSIECILRPATIMAGILNGKDAEPDMLCYEAPFGVGMSVCCYRILNPENGAVNTVKEYDKILIDRIKAKLEYAAPSDDVYVRVAKKAVETFVLDGKVITPEETGETFSKDILEKTAGVFVSLNMGKLVRGCMGTFSATKENIIEEVIANAVDACCNDPRFIPVEIEELDGITYSVEVLGTFENIGNIAQVNVGKHGLFVSYGQKTGIMLPKVEGITSSQQMLDICLEKAGIKENEKYNMYRFKTVKHE